MREIKFRAWDKDRKQMFVHSKWVEFTINKSGILTAKNYNRKGNEQQLITMQYTGLKDKNGKEIYEGDIARTECNIYPIIYSNGGFRRSDEDVSWDFNREWIEAYGVEITGNIYENPELMEGE